MIKQKNPYLWRSTVTKKDAFFGREALLEQIIEFLTGVGKPQCCSVVGEHRIGKSSLLYQLYIAYYKEGELPENFIVVCLDLQLDAPTRSEDFFRLLYDELERELRQTEYRHIVESIPKIDNWDDIEKLRKSFTLILRYLTETHNINLVFIFDEIEALIHRGATTNEFFAYLRAASQLYNVAYVVSSRLPLQYLCQKYDFLASRFHNIFTVFRLSLMSDDEVSALLSEPLVEKTVQFSSTDKSFIRRLAGNHPYLLQLAAYEVLEYRLRESTEKLTASHRPTLKCGANEIETSFQMKARGVFYDFWSRFSLEEQEVMFNLAQSASALKNVDERIKESLHERGFLVKEGEMYRIFSGGFANFLKQHPNLETLPQKLDRELSLTKRVDYYYDSAQRALRVDAILPDFKSYVERDGFRLFWTTEKPKEETGRTLLQAFFKPLVNLIEGYDFTEPHSGAGRLDLTIITGRMLYLFETKIWRGLSRYRKALEQLLLYMRQEGLDTAYLIIFDETRLNTLLKQNDNQQVFVETDGAFKINVYFVKIKPKKQFSPPAGGSQRTG
jgi:hypothetical protein